MWVLGLRERGWRAADLQAAAGYAKTNWSGQALRRRLLVEQAVPPPAAVCREYGTTP